MDTLYIGADVAAQTLSVCVLCAGGWHRLELCENTATGLECLQKTLTARFPDYVPAQYHLCLEPTGGYEQPLSLFAHEKGWQVSLPNPKHVRDWAKGLGQRAKTDRIDARLLARYAAERKPVLWHPTSAEVSQLDSLLERKRDLEQMLQQERNRKQQGAYRPQQAEAVTASVAGVLSHLEQALQEIEQAIAAHLKQHPTLSQQVRQLQTVPGVGRKNVLPLVVTLSRFAALTQGTGTAKALTAYAGLDPTTHESGTSVRGPGGISRLGNRRLRQQLYMGALGGKRGRNALRAFYERLVGRGKAKKVALVAAAHKILTWAWAVFCTQTDFDANKVSMKPATAS